MLTRRNLMREAGAALVGLVAAPNIVTLNPLALFGVDTDENHFVYDPFTAEAAAANVSLSDSVFGGSLRLQEPYFALMSIYDQLGLKRDWSYGLGYREAGPCKSEYERKEAEWRRNNNYNLFLSIQRPLVDREIAYAIANKVNAYSNALDLNAQGAVQYRDLPAVTLADNDAGLLLAASILFQGDSPSQQEAAQSLAAISKRAALFTGYDQQVTRGTVLETPVSTIFHNPRPYTDPNSGRYHNRGRVYVHNRKRSRQIGSIKHAGLYM